MKKIGLFSSGRDALGMQALQQLCELQYFME